MSRPKEVAESSGHLTIPTVCLQDGGMVGGKSLENMVGEVD
jgi:hypothetical protein